MKHSPLLAITGVWMLATLGACCPTSAAAAGPKIPILMYHYIEDHDDLRDRKGANLFIPPATFKAQLQWLDDHGYQTISLDEMLGIFDHTHVSPKKPVVLTFDDGWEDHSRTVLPLLLKHHMRGVFYVISGFLGKKGFVTAEDVRAMAAAGMIIASHTVSHVDLHTLSAKALHAQLFDSKKTLETLLGLPVTHFAYPSGKYNASVLKQMKKAGYATAVTTHHGFASPRDNPLTLPRIRMTKKTRLSSILS